RSSCATARYACRCCRTRRSPAPARRPVRCRFRSPGGARRSKASTPRRSCRRGPAPCCRSRSASRPDGGKPPRRTFRREKESPGPESSRKTLPLSLCLPTARGSIPHDGNLHSAPDKEPGATMSSMTRIPLYGLALLATTVLTASVPLVAQQDAVESARHSLTATVPSQIGQAVERWKFLTSNDHMGFAAYAGLALAFPEFPRMDVIRARAEGALERDAPTPEQLVAYFDRNPP